ncbi:chromatin assembly factor 1 subunit A-domain-containing protein [Lipomyces orientalis]|uniref:Chromatin assembly factor 1 subunit A-domain-containing protein n=1 Tax=Lipomyces orientalis TaxID=1233043 RepID=A0ACC3TSJ8_9ASCO
MDAPTAAPSRPPAPVVVDLDTEVSVEGHGCSTGLLQTSTTSTNSIPATASVSTAVPENADVIDIGSSPMGAPPVRDSTLSNSRSEECAPETDDGSAEKKRKRTKLTGEEKAEREDIRKKKAEELEKRRAEKAAKDAEREEKRRAKEEQKRAREEGKRKKEEELKQKDRQQLRLGNFFNKKPSPATSTPVAETKVPDVANKSDYEEVFLPFHVKANATLYPGNAFTRNCEALDSTRQHLDRLVAQLRSSQSAFDAIVVPEQASSPPNIAEIMNLHPLKLRRRGRIATHTARDVISLFNNESTTIATKNGKLDHDMSEKRLRAALQSLPRKFLRFWEDFRPPYMGTFTKTRQIPRNNPFFLDERLNYEYNSEAEWVEEDGEIGEDIEAGSNDSEDDEESAVGDFIDDEMKDFLVSEEEDRPRRSILAPLVPVAKGICWTDLNTGINDEFDGTGMQIATIHPAITLPIDPFKDYFAVTNASSFNLCTASASKTPFQPSNTNNFASTSSRSLTMRISEKDLKEILLKIHGSDMTQIMLIESLKREFKSIPKESIRLTIKEVAKRVGDRETDKRWVIDSDVWSRYIAQNNTK